MPPIDENTILVIGKYYNVRCAVVVNQEGGLVANVPIIGTLHADPQFSLNKKHYHVDGRFNNKQVLVDKNGKTNQVLEFNKDYGIGNVFMTFTIKRKKCKRLTTGIKPPKTFIPYWDWYNSMVGKSCQGRKCPHLGTLMQEIDGRLVCPLHSLNGDLETEIIIPVK